MNIKKRKATIDPPSTDNEVQKVKAVWDLKTTEQFIQACLDQVYKGERNGTSLTKKGGEVAISQFNTLSEKKYDKAQLKNKWDSLKKEWSVWHKLFAKETGLGWDSVKNTVDAPDEWYEKKQLENPQYGKFRNKGLPFAHQLSTFFKDVVATGQFAWALSLGILPNSLDENDDGYRPCLESVCVDMEEGSGDSEDVSAEATEEIANINLSTSQGTISQISGGKRKRLGPSERKSKAKVPASSRIADAVNVITETCRSRNVGVPGTYIGEVMAELQNLDDVANDPDWHSKCCQLMMLKPAREMFVGLCGFEEKRLHWLRHAANNPLPFMNM